MTEPKQAEETKKERSIQAWLSALSSPASQVEAFDKKWQQRLQEMFQT
jgi:hypothetical protein